MLEKQQKNKKGKKVHAVFNQVNFLSVNFFIGICSEDEKEFKFCQIKTSEYLNFFI
jgi:hypothetical protein